MARSKIYYYVNKDKGVVVAKQTIYSIHGCTITPKTIRAKAKCNFENGDNFNLDTGKTIAKLRLKQKIAQFEVKALAGVLNMFMDILDNHKDKLENANSKYESYIKTV